MFIIIVIITINKQHHVMFKENFIIIVIIQLQLAEEVKAMAIKNAYANSLSYLVT